MRSGFEPTNHGVGPQLMVVTGLGKYVWTPALQVIDYIKVDRRRPASTHPLSASENNRAGVMRRIGAHLATNDWRLS